MDTKFEDSINAIFKSMVEIGYEYIEFNKNNEVDTIYVFVSLEMSQYFDFFYKINDKIVKRHLVNENLSVKIDDSDERDDGLMDLGFEDIEKLISTCSKFNQEIPNQIRIVYSLSNEDFNAQLNYEPCLIKSKLHVTDLEDECIEKL